MHGVIQCALHPGTGKNTRFSDARPPGVGGGGGGGGGVEGEVLGVYITVI